MTYKHSSAPIKRTKASNPPLRLVIGLTGASGMIYAQRLLDHLLKTNLELHLVISKQAQVVLYSELGLDLSYFRQLPVFLHDDQDFSSPLASGSFFTWGMVIIPCSMHTVGAIAHGLCLNLIHRAAAVCLKERRQLILVPRETPLSSLHLDNMLSLSRLGTWLIPAMPSFYHHPKNIEELVEFFVQRVLGHLPLPSPQRDLYSGLNTTSSTLKGN